jgi:hypothetical protein
LIPNPIRKVLSSMRARRVRALLMGGQASVFYGAAEFSASPSGRRQSIFTEEALPFAVATRREVG